MATKYGRQSVDTQLSTNRYFDITPEVFLKQPDENPFIALMMELQRVVSGDPKFKWFNKDIRPMSTGVINSAANAGDTTIEVTDASIFVANDLIRVIDGTTKAISTVVHKVASVNTTTNVVTVVRAVIGTDANIAIGDTLLRVANAHEEGSDIPDASQMDLTEFYNYTQIVRHSADYTRTLFESNKFHVDAIKKELQTNRGEKTKEHSRETEMMMIYGKRGIINPNTKNPTRFTAGLDDWLQISATEANVDNRQAVAGLGALDLATFMSFLDTKAFAYGGHEKWAFAPSGVISVLSQLTKSMVRVEDNRTNFGLKTTTFEFTSGTIHLIRHDLLKYGSYANSLLVFDPSHLRIRYIGESMTRFKSDVGLASKDAYQDSWLTEAGLQVFVPESLARLSNIVSAA